MKTLKKISFVILALLLWTAFISFGFIDGFLLRPITADNTTQAFIDAAQEMMNTESVGNFAMALIEDGKVSKNLFYSQGEPVNENTVFQVASISKWITSFGVMKLVEQGKLDLDKPIDDYLTRWHLPKSEYDNRKVTIRRLLSHSAGLVDGLGYAGYKPRDTVQSLEESLTKASDGEYSEGIARVGKEPGTEYIYSGAGYTILQLLIEEVTGQSFQHYMTQAVFEPLDMQNSTFDLSKKPNLPLAQLFKNDGTFAEPLTFTALAAASLYTSTADLSKFLLSNVSDNAVLSKETISQMSRSETYINEIGVYGLGPHLYSQNDKESLIIGHDGSGSYLNTAARIDLKSKDGIIVLERGSQALASFIADEWMYCNAGIADYVVLMRNIPYLIKLLVIGALVIIGISIFMIIRLK